MSQRQVMLRAEHRGRKLLGWLLLLALCLAIVDALNPGLVRKAVADVLKAVPRAGEYVADVFNSLRQFADSLRNWFR